MWSFLVVMSLTLQHNQLARLPSSSEERDAAYLQKAKYVLLYTACALIVVDGGGCGAQSERKKKEPAGARARLHELTVVLPPAVLPHPKTRSSSPKALKKEQSVRNSAVCV